MMLGLYDSCITFFHVTSEMFSIWKDIFTQSLNNMRTDAITIPDLGYPECNERWLEHDPVFTE